MKIVRTILIIFLMAFINSIAQQSSFQDSLLERMTGEWLMEGTIAGQQITHDLSVSWILEHQYLQIKEISREKDPDGTAAYEALVLIGWNPDLNMYACMWLDVTGGSGLNGEGIGHTVRKEDSLPFLFNGSDGSKFHTTFIYERENDAWRWTMDSERNGTFKQFARVKLMRK